MIDPAENTTSGPAASEDDATEASRAWFDDPSTLHYRAALRLSRLTNGRFRSPHFRSLERLHRERDAAENEECRPAPEQRLRTWVLWATEAYTPAHAQRLLTALEAFGPVPPGADRDPAEWIRKQRGRPGSRLYMYFQRPDAGFRSLGFDTELPNFAERCFGTLWSATPSLTMLTMSFFLSDDERGRIEAVLRAEHPTRLEPHGGTSIGIHSPELERRRLIAETRASWRAQAASWFERNAPGLLTTTAEGLATCEFTVLNGLSPYRVANRGESDRRDLRLQSALAMRPSSVFVPRDEERPEESDEGDGRGTFFAPVASHDPGLRRHSSVVMDEGNFRADDNPFWGEGEGRHAHRFDASFRDVPAQWAVRHVIDHFSDRTLATRDELAMLVGRTRVGAALARVRRDTAECADAATVARDIHRGAADGSLGLDDRGFTLRRMRLSDEERRMGRVLRDTLKELGSELGQDVADLNATLHAQASLLSAHANLRLQPWIVLLAIVSAIAGLVAAIEPMRALVGADARPPAQTGAVEERGPVKASVAGPPLTGRVASY